MKGFLMLMLMVCTIFNGGCGSKANVGQPIPPNITATKLSEVFKNPKAFKDREVVLQGNYGQYCCATDFSYKEGLDIVQVSPNGFDTPKDMPGRPVVIYGVVRVGQKNEGFEDEKAESKEKGEAKYYVYIEAKGVRFK